MGWGAINARLNRLVSEGAITGFRTNLSSPGRHLGLHVIVTAPGANDAARADAVRRRVAAALRDLGEDAVVTVDRSGELFRTER